MSAAALKDEGNTKFKKGDYAGAVKAYTESLESDPAQHLCYSNRSAAYLKLRDSAREALADAQKCVELAPSFSKGYSRQAAALQELERWEEAIAICEKGIANCSKEDADSLRKTVIEVNNRHFTSELRGCWHGKVTEALGGYDQEMEFIDHCQVRVQVLGRSIMGQFRIDATKDPRHLDIQVTMEDIPAGMPPPPPVPYIAKVDKQGLHLCCPYMKMERPDHFGGEGYCLMTKGAMEQDSDASLVNLSKEERLLLCAREVIAAFPSRKLEEPHQQDSDEATREKVMAQVKFETSIYKVQQKFGEEMMKEVLDSAKADAVGVRGLSGTPELEELKAKIRMMDGGNEPPTMPPNEAAASTQPVRPAEPKSDSAPPPISSGEAFPTALCVVSIAAAAMVLLAGGFWLQRRREWEGQMVWLDLPQNGGITDWGLQLVLDRWTCARKNSLNLQCLGADMCAANLDSWFHTLLRHQFSRPLEAVQLRVPEAFETGC